MKFKIGSWVEHKLNKEKYKVYSYSYKEDIPIIYMEGSPTPSFLSDVELSNFCYLDLFEVEEVDNKKS